MNEAAPLLQWFAFRFFFCIYVCILFIISFFLSLCIAFLLCKVHSSTVEKRRGTHCAINVAEIISMDLKVPILCARHALRLARNTPSEVNDGPSAVAAIEKVISGLQDKGRPQVKVLLSAASLWLKILTGGCRTYAALYVFVSFLMQQLIVKRLNGEF